MQPTHPLKKHLAVSGGVILTLGIIFFIAYEILRDRFLNPERYAVGALPSAEMQFFFISISIIIVIVLIGYIAYLLLTAKTRAELWVYRETEHLVYSRDQFQRLYDEAPVPYITLGENGEIREPNKATLRFFNAVPEDLIGKNLFTLEPEYEIPRANQLFEYYKRNIPINREEIRIITKKGTIKWVSLSVFTTKNAENSKKRTGIATLFDITEQKQLDQAKTEFVSLASHQLRSPSVTIKWGTTMLLSGDIGELTPKQNDYVHRIHTANEDMIDLVDTLLNVSRIEIGSLAIDRKPTNARELSEGIINELMPQIIQKNIRIDAQYNNYLENINSDPKLLRIIIQNLVSNAVKYTPDGGTVTITFSESERDKHVTVTDTGYGIPKEQQDKIFTKLFRADNVRKLTNSQGTGLGLYLTKSIAESLGGGISFISEENHGTSFTLTL
jgi:PAS domain S-box-containing protein